MRSNGGRRRKGGRKIDENIKVLRCPANARRQPKAAKKMMDRLNKISEEFAMHERSHEYDRVYNIFWSGKF